MSDSIARAGPDDPARSRAPGSRRAALAATVFVLVWSTGFIVARGIAPRADPNLFLAARFALCGAVLVALARRRGLPWPGRGLVGRLLGIGALLQGVYLCGAFWAVGQGLQPGLMALIGALQPPLTAALAVRFHGESLGGGARLGIALGVGGVALAVWPHDALAPVGAPVLLAACASVAAITAGTLLQKGAVASVPIVTSSAIQNAGAFVVAATLATLLGEDRLPADAATLGLLLYAVAGLSLGGTTLLLWLVRGGSVTRATSLFFLVPPLAALMAWWLFDDALEPRQIAGFAVASAGVYLARRRVGG